MHKHTPSIIRVIPILLVLLTFIACTGCDEQEAVRIARKHHAVLPPDGTPRSLKIHGDQEAADAVIPLVPELSNIIAVEVHRVPLTQEQLRVIGRKSDVQFLSLQKCELDDSDLSLLAGMEGLRTLRIDQNSVNGPGLKHLDKLKKLSSLSLTRNAITGPGLDKLAPLESLRELRVGSNPIDDEGIEYLLHIKRLAAIDLTSTDISAKGYLKLADLLWLSHIGYSDDLVGPDNDMDKRMQARRDLHERFQNARLEALMEAKMKGMDVPAR